MKFEWITINGYRLRAPKQFIESEFVNTGRCGPGDGLIEYLVPDTILGLNVTLACAIHDYCYEFGETEQDKTDADIELFANGFRIIKQKKSNKFMSIWRSMILGKYFLACAYGGDSSFNK